MKKRISSLMKIFCLAIVVTFISSFCGSAYASSDSSVDYMQPQSSRYNIGIVINGQLNTVPSGTIVGYNHITTGEYVTIAQRALNNVYSLDSTYREDFSHCSCGTVDGIFGQRTYQAVYYFQSAVGLSPDGIVGDNTWSGFSYYCL